MKLLIADDSPEIAQRLAAEFSAIEDVVVIGPARDGREALELFERHAPDGAVLDLQMPELSGLEVLTAIRERDRTCLVVIVTIHGAADLRDRCLEAGADFYAHKARDLERVLQIVSEFSKVSR